MSKEIESQIILAEEKLKAAMLSSDTDSLRKLLGDDLVFTNHFGQLMSKEDDISVHQSGALDISKIELFEQKVIVVSNTAAVVSVRAEITGTYEGQEASGGFRFTRVWGLSESNEWRIVAAHSGTTA